MVENEGEWVAVRYACTPIVETISSNSSLIAAAATQYAPAPARAGCARRGIEHK